MSDKNFHENHASGLIVIRSETSNFNADFTGTPRRLPDDMETIYATDKSLKYCIRNYLNDKAEDPVFAWRRRLENKETFMNVAENYEYLFKKELDKLKGNGGKKRAEILKDLLKCIDVRLFGATFAPPSYKGLNISITGPVQISYGINRFEGGEYLTNQILSPYRSKRKEEKAVTSIGEESKALESHYVFDFTVNPNHLKKRVEHLSEKDEFGLYKSDVELFKEAARRSVSALDTSSMIDSENELLLYLEFENPLLLQNMRDFVRIEAIERENAVRKIDLTALENYLIGNYEVGEEKGKIKKVEVYYDPHKLKVEGLLPSKKKEISEFQLINGDKIER